MDMVSNIAVYSAVKQVHTADIQAVHISMTDSLFCIPPHVLKPDDREIIQRLNCDIRKRVEA